MFLKEFFKNCAERRAKKAHEKEAKYAELASKKKYWARSKELYDFLWSAMLKMDRCSPITITCGCELYSVGGLAYSVDKRLRVNVIKYFDSGSPFSLSNSFHYEAEFLIDDVVVDFDFTKPWYSVGVKSYGETVFMRLADYVRDSVNAELSAYERKKAKIIDDYSAWKDTSHEC